MVISKYTNFADLFPPDLALKLLNHNKINNHPINLGKDQQPPYETIYRLRLIVLEALERYIETNLTNGFMKPSKSPTKTPIFFV